MMGLDAPRQTLMENLGGKTAFRRSMGKKTAVFEEKDLLGDALRSPESLPASASSRKGRLTLVSVGKVEHAHEGCACPMGVLAKTFINGVPIDPGQWLLVDTEAGVEHFGRGILEGVDAVVAVLDPSYDALMLVGKIRAMTGEGGKRLHVVLNKTDGEMEALMRAELEKQQIEAACTLLHSTEIARANLRALPLNVSPVRKVLGPSRSPRGIAERCFCLQKRIDKKRPLCYGFLKRGTDGFHPNGQRPAFFLAYR
jgi:CO dehydrogenase maturation factor